MKLTPRSHFSVEQSIHLDSDAKSAKTVKWDIFDESIVVKEETFPSTPVIKDEILITNTALGDFETKNEKKAGSKHGSEDASHPA
eukprot:scaffold25852_cov76-Amphora_coffeaeformis.AAC.1